MPDSLGKQAHRVKEPTLAASAEPERCQGLRPDFALCTQCLRELSDPRDRRYRYPFTSCAACGPRFTIVLEQPGDRARTTMAPFQMCQRCRGEFADPGNRRYQDPSNACPECGPAYWIEPTPPPLARGDVVDDVAALLREGQIVAVKGVGGFQLVCLARNEGALLRLRRRKRLDCQPLPVMVVDAPAAERLVELSPGGRALLLDRSAPMVVARKRQPEPLPAMVSPDSGDYGVQLPTTAFDHLLAAATGEPLVVTSAHRRGDPAILDNEDARTRLLQLADSLVFHDRPIHHDCAVSVVRDGGEAPLVSRRSRGSVPEAIALPSPLPPSLALGATGGAVVGVARDQQAFLGPYWGEVRSPRALDGFQRGVEQLLRLLGVTPRWVIHGLEPHPALATFGQQRGVTTIAVQQHHAELAGVLIEHGLSSPALGVCMDGGAAGDDGTCWGGEFLVGQAASCARAAHLPVFRIPRAGEEFEQPWRSALGLLWDQLGADAARHWAECALPDRPAADQALAQLRDNRACLATSALGHLLDASAALLGLCVVAQSPDQARQRLARAAGEPRPLQSDLLSPGHFAEDRCLAGMLEQLIERSAGLAARHTAREQLAAGLLGALARWIAATAVRVAHQHDVGCVVASGACSANPWLRVELRRHVRAARLELFFNRRVPPGEGGLALGQLGVAAARALEGN